MGYAGRGAIARQSNDVETVRPEFKPRHELAID
jgi:hypothetical protein